MLKMKDLKNRTYADRQCVSFDCAIAGSEENDDMLFRFWRLRLSGPVEAWAMQLVIGRTQCADSQVYNFSYEMPKAGMPLEIVAAMGMRLFKLHLAEEIQRKAGYEFAIGEAIAGM